MSLGGEHSGRFLDSSDRVEASRTFSALGASKEFIGLERFPNPGVRKVRMETSEVTAQCPVTGQPDWYTVIIDYVAQDYCLESKSLKLYLHALRDQQAFVEALARLIMDEVCMVLEIEEEDCMVTMIQKPRGGITITAVA